MIGQKISCLGKLSTIVYPTSGNSERFILGIFFLLFYMNLFCSPRSRMVNKFGETPQSHNLQPTLGPVTWTLITRSFQIGHLEPYHPLFEFICSQYQASALKRSATVALTYWFSEALNLETGKLRPPSVIDWHSNPKNRNYLERNAAVIVIIFS